MKTYELRTPRSTHTRAATCEEVECAAHVRGWVTSIDVSTELGRNQADYIRHQSGRHFTESGRPGMVEFRFPPGQRCFNSNSHRVFLEREPLYIVRSGDWREYGRVGRRHTRAEDWIDDFQGNQQALKERLG